MIPQRNIQTSSWKRPKRCLDSPSDHFNGAGSAVSIKGGGTAPRDADVGIGDIGALGGIASGASGGSAAGAVDDPEADPAGAGLEGIWRVESNCGLGGAPNGELIGVGLGCELPMGIIALTG